MGQRHLRELWAEPGRRRRGQADPCPALAARLDADVALGCENTGELLGNNVTKHLKVFGRAYLSLTRD